MQSEVPEVAKELFNIISQIKGVKNVSESLNLSYVVVVEDEESKKGVEEVSNVLAEQAKKFGFELDVTTATEEEVQLARDKMAEFVSQNTTFKA